MTDALRSRCLAALFAAAALFAFTRKVDNNDIGFHLRLGHEIRSSGRVPTEDRHSFTADGAPFLAQEWLSEVLLHALHERTGWAGLSLAAGLCAAGTFGVLRLAMGGGILADLLILLWIAPLMASHMMARPHVLGWLMLAVLLWRMRRDRSWEIPALLALWANLHASFLLGAGLAGLHFLERRRWGWAAAAGLAPLLNPYGWHLYAFFPALRDLPLEILGEFGRYPPSSGFFWVWAVYAGLLVVGLARRRPTNAFDWVRAAVLVPAGFWGMRYAVVGAIALAPLQSSLWAGTLARVPGRLFSGILASGILAGAVSMACWRDAGRAGLDEEALPVASTEFLVRHGISGPLFNDYNFGGWLLWKAWPGLKVFVDGRMDVYRGEPIHNYLCVSTASPGWERALDHYAIRVVMVRPERAVSHALVGHPGWDLAYFDMNSVIYLRKGAFPSVRRLKELTPYGHRDRNRIAELTDEIRYLLGENARFWGGRKILAILLLRSGDLEGARGEIRRYLELRPEGRDLPDTREVLEKLGMR